MELEPQTETGKRLLIVLANWMKKSPELAVDKLKRLFLIISLRVKNQDGFVAALYGQNILDDTPSILSWRFPSSLLKVQYGMEITLNKRRAKELVVALELSENQILLWEVFTWTQQNEIQHIIKRPSSVDLAQVKTLKSKEIQESVKVVSTVAVDRRTGVVTPRYREINWTEEGKHCTALEVSLNMIIVGWNDGQIKIYNNVDLYDQTVLNYGGSQVTCLQCTGTEIIAGYKDGNICVWNIQRGVVVQKLSMGSETCERHFPTCMRWRDGKLVTGTLDRRIHIWYYVRSWLTLLDCWYAGDRQIQAVDMNESYVILQPWGVPETVHVHHFNGQHFRTISTRVGILQMAVHGSHLITNNRFGRLQIWDISTGDCLKELRWHGIYMFGFDAQDGMVVSGNRRGSYAIWSVQAALEGNQASLASLSSWQTQCMPFHEASVKTIKLGTHFLVATSRDRQHEKKIFVTDFLY